MTWSTRLSSASWKARSTACRTAKRWSFPSAIRPAVTGRIRSLCCGSSICRSCCRLPTGAIESGQLQHVDPVGRERVACRVVLAYRHQLLNGVGAVQRGVQVGEQARVVVEDGQARRGGRIADGKLTGE